MMSLVTGVTSLTSGPTAEILATVSEKNERNRLVHHPSCTALSNFPFLKKKHISPPPTGDLSPRSAWGSEKGKAPKFRWRHYSDF